MISISKDANEEVHCKHKGEFTLQREVLHATA